ncbi:hypothetical protein [Paraburkholderia youngii]|uniref:hypothetical protein n=1 Tax=Paraburkholderia youngii TaxID=2782701 RepID=UPI003D1D076A
MHEDTLAEREAEPAIHVSALDDETLSRVDHICADLEWLADFPSYNWKAVETRHRIHLATLLARAVHAVPMAVPFEFKHEDALIDSGLGPENGGTALDDEARARVDRLRVDLAWVAEFPSYNWKEVDSRKRIHLATLLACSLHVVPMAFPFELKNEERNEWDTGHDTQTVQLRLRTAWGRRLVSRDFYFIQSKLFRWGGSYKISDYIAEFHLRAADAMDTYAVDDGLLSLLPCHITTVRVTCAVAGALLERVCELDRHFAATIARRLHVDNEPLYEHFELLNEPLAWIKGRACDTPTSRFRLRVAGAHVIQRKKPRSKQKAHAALPPGTDIPE